MRTISRNRAYQARRRRRRRRRRCCRRCCRPRRLRRRLRLRCRHAPFGRTINLHPKTNARICEIH